jgi:hypothetical protein
MNIHMNEFHNINICNKNPTKVINEYKIKNTIQFFLKNILL